MIKVQSNGRLTVDPVIRSTNSGTQCAGFSIACPTNKKKADGTGYETMFMNATAWGKKGEYIAKYFKKGDRMIFAGDLSTREYVGNDGAKRMTVEVNIQDAEMVDYKKQETPVAPPPQQVETGYTQINEDELPF